MQYITVLLALSILLLSSCAGSLTLEKQERLYRGAKVKTDYAKGISHDPVMETALNRAVKEPRPNKGLLGFRPRVFFHNLSKNGSKVQKKIGVSPVLLSEISPQKTEELLKNIAYNHGYFDAEIASKVQKKWFRRSKIKYTVTANSPAFRIENVQYPEPYDSLRQLLTLAQPKTFLTPSSAYKLDQLRAERLRLAKVLQKDGYYFFKDDYLFFRADTNAQARSVRLIMELKPDIPAEALVKYHIGQVQVKVSNSPLWIPNADWPVFNDSISCASLQMEKDMVQPSLIFESLKLNCGALINPNDLEETYLRINHLGIFKFIDLHPEPDTSDGVAILHLEIRLVPYKRYYADAGVSALWTPKVQTGFDVNAVVRRRNNFLKGHGLKWTGSGAFYTLNSGINGGINGNTVQEWKSSIEYSIPRYKRFILSQNRAEKGYLKQLLSLDYSGTGIDYAKTDSITALGIRYHEVTGAWKMAWKNSQKPTLTQSFQPAELSFQWSNFRPTSINVAIRDSIRYSTDNAYLAFAPTFSISPEYQFLYDNKLENRSHLSTFWQSKVRFSTSTILLSKQTRDLIGSKIRLRLFLENDLRFFQKTTKNQTMVSRIVGRWGIPLNRGGRNFFSIQELYSIGGATSIRAFPLRGLGPGNTDPSQITSSPLGVTSQLGNILLQGNLEYRYLFAKKWETAAFLDAGNVWNGRNRSESQEGVFSLNQFYKEIALGTGLGLRFHYEYIIVRLDWGIRLHTPYLPEGERWIRPQLGKKAWWTGQTALQFAFGYPF